MSNKLRSRGADICRNGRPPHASPCYPRGLAGSWRNCSSWPVGPWLRERGSTRRAVSALNRFHFRSNFPNGSAQVGNMRALGLESFFSLRHRNNTSSSLKYLISRSLHFPTYKVPTYSNMPLIPKSETSAKVNKTTYLYSYLYYNFLLSLP